MFASTHRVQAVLIDLRKGHNAVRACRMFSTHSVDSTQDTETMPHSDNELSQQDTKVMNIQYIALPHLALILMSLRAFGELDPLCVVMKETEHL